MYMFVKLLVSNTYTCFMSCIVALSFIRFVNELVGSCRMCEILTVLPRMEMPP